MKGGGTKKRLCKDCLPEFFYNSQPHNRNRWTLIHANLAHLNTINSSKLITFIPSKMRLKTGTPCSHNLWLMTLKWNLQYTKLPAELAESHKLQLATHKSSGQCTLFSGEQVFACQLPGKKQSCETSPPTQELLPEVPVDVRWCHPCSPKSTRLEQDSRHKSWKTLLL